MTVQALLQTPGLAWLIFAALLGIAELISPGIFLVFIAAGAAVAGLVTLAVPGISPVLQVLIFAAASAMAVAVGRRMYRRGDVPSPDPLLNDRAARLIGEVVTVVDAIEAGQGRVRVGDGEWIARGPDTPKGDRVRVIGAEGTCLDVEPMTS